MYVVVSEAVTCVVNQTFLADDPFMGELLPAPGHYGTLLQLDKHVLQWDHLYSSPLPLRPDPDGHSGSEVQGIGSHPLQECL